MFLEETLEALEVQEDSGLSNDEAESLSLEEKLRQIRLEDVTDFVPEAEEVHAGDEVECQAPNEASKPQALLHVLKDENGELKGVSKVEPEVDLSVIPPPSDFMDELEPPSAPEPPPAEIMSSPRPRTVDVEALRRRASAKVTQELPDKPAGLSADVGHHKTPLPPPSPPSSPPPLFIPPPPPEALEPRSPPAVAPKPKRLPANILLKSHRAAAASDCGSGLPLMPDPQKVHIEALRKLGLLKSDEVDSGPALSPRLSPQTRRSWATSPPPVSPRTPPATPAHSRLGTPPPSSPLAQAPPTPPSDPPSFMVPAPAAFSDFEGPSWPERDKATTAGEALSSTSPPGSLCLIKQLTPPRSKAPRSASNERSGSGSGLSSYAATRDPSGDKSGADGRSPGQLRNTRPRPSSLGSRQEFSASAKEGAPPVSQASGKEPDSRRSLPSGQPSGSSPRLPRPQGISVLICPRSENGDKRREALRRLGLLRD